MQGPGETPVSIPHPMLPPVPPPSLGHWWWLCPESCAGPQRLPPCQSLLRLSPPPASIQLEVSVLHLHCPRGNSAGESETRWLQRSHMHTTHPPDTPSVSPKSWQGPWLLSQHLQPRLCCCDPSWSSVGTERLSSSCRGLGLGWEPVLGPFVGAQPLQGDLGEHEHRATPPLPRGVIFSPSPCRCWRSWCWSHLWHGVGVSSAWLACAITLEPSLHIFRAPSGGGFLPAGSFLSPFPQPPLLLSGVTGLQDPAQWAIGSHSSSMRLTSSWSCPVLQPAMGFLPVCPFPPLGGKPEETQM